MRGNRISCFLVAVTAAVAPNGLAPLPAAAEDSSELVGEVLDPVGAGLPGASVRLLLADGASRKVVSDGAGSFRFDTLPAGVHRLTVEMAGFRGRTIEVEVGEAGEVRISIPMEVAFAEAITVLGTQVERRLHEENASVAVIDAERLRTNTEEDLHDLVDMTPNVSSPSRERGFSIRGISQGGFSSRSGMLVNVQLDGVSAQDSYATRYGAFSTWDMHQVEVFRGPQSTQQGRNSLAGAIVMRTSDPIYEREIRARARLGNANARQLAAALNLPLAGNRAAFRVSVEQRGTDGFLTNPTVGDPAYGFEDYQSARAKLRFDPVARFGGLLTVSRVTSRAGGSMVAVERFPEERVNLSNADNRGEATQQSAVLDLHWNLGGALTLESVSTLTSHDYMQLGDLDQSPVPGGALDSGVDQQWLTQELRLRYADGRRAEGVFGVYYADIGRGEGYDLAGPGELAGLPPGFTATATYNIRSDTRNAALFSEFDFHLAVDWTFTLGARYDQEQFDQTTIQGITIEPAVPGIPVGDGPPVSIGATYSAFLPKATVHRAWTNTLATSIGWQKGYRAGGQSIAVVSQRIADYGPEFVDNFELALRADDPAGRWNLHLNTFYTSWTDQQVRVMTELGLPVDTITANAGESTLYGAEAEAAYRPTREIELFGSFGLLEARFDQFADEGRDFTGNTFPYASPWSTLVGIAVRPTNDWSGRVDVASQGPFFSDATNNPLYEVDGRTIVNARAGYRFGSWGIFAFGRNLLDATYFTGLWAHPIPGFGALGRAGEPRTIGIELDFNFR